MSRAVFVPFLAGAWFAVIGPWLLRRARPSVGVWAGSIGAGVAAAGSTWSLALLVVSLLDLSTGLLEKIFGDATANRLLSAEPRVTQALAVVAVPLLAAVGWRLHRMVVGRRRLHHNLRAVCPASTAQTGGKADLVVLDDPVPEAFALPGRPPYVVVSSGMLSALSPAERRVLLAHERAHLTDRHNWHLALAEAAAALNPLLLGVRNACVFLCERWADEQAAEAVADRRLTARALARAALAAQDHSAPREGTPSQNQTPRPAGAFHEHDVPGRVAALYRPPVRRRLMVVLGALVLVGGVLFTEIDATGDLLSMLLRLT